MTGPGRAGARTQPTAPLRCHCPGHLPSEVLLQHRQSYRSHSRLRPRKPSRPRLRESTQLREATGGHAHTSCPVASPDSSAFSHAPGSMSCGRGWPGDRAPNPVLLPASPKFAAGRRGSCMHRGRNATSGRRADTSRMQAKEGARQSRRSQGHPAPWAWVPRTSDHRGQETTSSSIGGSHACASPLAAFRPAGVPAARTCALAPHPPLDKTLRLRPQQLKPLESHQQPPAPCRERCARDGPVSSATPGAYSLFRSANSSSEGFRSGLRLGNNFFMVLGLLLRS